METYNLQPEYDLEMTIEEDGNISTKNLKTGKITKTDAKSNFMGWSTTRQCLDHYIKTRNLKPITN